MDDEDFDDLLAGADMLEDSSQESLVHAVARVHIPESIARDHVLDLDERRRYSVHDYANQVLDSPTLRNRLVSMSTAPQPLSPHEAEIPTGVDRQMLGPNHADDRTELTVLERIQAIFTGLTSDLLSKNNELSISLKTRRPTTATNARDMSRTRSICFPGKNATEAWRFSVVVRILELIYAALRENVVLSKRDIYYRDPALFGNQTHVDRYVDDIAFTFDVSRSQLNVTAAAKGLFVGGLQICNRDGSIVDASSDREGTLVPSLDSVLSVDMRSIKWVLVVEKEASFRSIAASRFWTDASTAGILITGKGYPDIATRAFLRFLSTPSPQNGFASPPIHGLVDFDPDGLAIMSVYKNGSIALAHRNKDLQVSQLQWLGLRIEHADVGGDDVHTGQGMLHLTRRDRRKAIKMLERIASSGNETEDSQISVALQTMLMLNVKAELQLLDARPSGIVSLLESTLDV